MIDLIIGGLGSGKTSYATYRLFYNIVNYGYIGYSNYKVNWIGFNGKPSYTEYPKVLPFESIGDFQRMQPGLKYVVLDEFYRTAHSRTFSSGLNLESTLEVAQSRKRDCDLAFLSQRGGKLDLDIRDVADFIHFPSIMTRRCNLCGYIGKNSRFGLLVICPKCGSRREGKPLVLKVETVWKEKPNRKKKNYILLVNPRLNIDIPASYDTREMIDTLKSTIKDGRENIISKYKNVCNNEKELTALIWKNEGVKASEANLLARLVLSK